MRFSKFFSLYLAATGIIIIFATKSYITQASLLKPTNYERTSIFLIIAVVLFLAILSCIAYKSWRSLIVNEWMRSFLVNTKGRWGILVLLSTGLFIGLLCYLSLEFKSFSPVFFWMILSLGLVSLKITYLAFDQWKYLFISIFIFFSESIGIYHIQKFLFPLENYWISIILALLLYCIFDCLFVVRSINSNIFISLDNGNFRFIDTVLLIFVPILASLVLYVLGQRFLFFIYPFFFLLFILHSCSIAVIFYFFDFVKKKRSLFTNNQGVTWVICLLSVILIYAMSFLSLKMYPTTNQLFEGPKEREGVFFTISVNKSDQFPYGFARLEDSLFDDLGRPFFAVLGQSLGMVDKCHFSGPETKFAMVSPDSRIQPKYGYTALMLCEEWLDTLPDFFWRIGLVGVFLFSLLIGIVILRNPIDFVLISLLFLVCWFNWPKSLFHRVGNVEVLISSMAFVGLIFPLIRRNRISYIIIWGLVSGFLFGMAGLVRQPSGFSLLVTSVISILIAGFQQRKFFIPILSICTLMVGYNLIPATANSLFIYRDLKLSITAPNIATRQHGSGFALLGGVGSSKPVYENSLDIEFYDESIFMTIYNENPLVDFTQRSYELLQNTGQKLFFQYVVRHPVEYINNTLLKTWSTFLLILQVPQKWLLLLILTIVASFIKRGAFKTDISISQAQKNSLKEIILVYTILIIIAALPAVITSPVFAESTYLPAAVLSFTGIYTIYVLLTTFPINLKGK